MRHAREKDIMGRRRWYLNSERLRSKFKSTKRKARTMLKQNNTRKQQAGEGLAVTTMSML